MFHPFLILPCVGAIMLAKILVSNILKPGYQRGTIAMLLLLIIILYALWYFVSDDMKPSVLWHYRAMPVNQPYLGFLFNNEQDDAILLLDIHQVQVPMEDRDRLRPAVVPIDDNTDVHNHQVQSSLRQSLERLKTWYMTTVQDPLDKPSTFGEIKAYIFNDYDDSVNKKEQAYNVLRYMEKFDGTLHDLGLKESAILQMIWQRINSQVNQSVQKELKDNLIDLLSDSSIKLDQPYCLVGRITRIVQSLQNLDKEGLVSIKNMQVINVELQSKIPLLQRQYFKEHPDKQHIYDQGDEQVGKDLQQYVKHKLEEHYPEANKDPILQKAIISHIEALA